MCYNGITKRKEEKEMKKKVVNRREAVNAMREFVNEASSLTYCSAMKKAHITMKKDTEDYGFAALVYWGWGINSTLKNHTIYYNFESLNHKPVSYFRSCWSEVNPIVKGFANVTIALLHELGHLHCQDDIILSGYTREQKQVELDEIAETAQNLEELNMKYFLLQDELTASLWAIEWLKDAEHRKMAKRFEKKFFACCK